MFRWYQKADICYAYLSDVPHSRPWLQSFQRSAWFTRGWTLQELLAPPEVRFFDNQWHAIGDKSDLVAEIEAITKIPKRALLRGFAEPRLLKFSIAQRMSWAAARDTSRVEDVAYCLMGLFEINMPLLYGEGERSFLRLQEEIMKVSNDETIFAWKPPDRPRAQRICLLAPHPSCFADFSDVVTASILGFSRYDVPYDTRLPYTMTNRGLQISARLHYFPGVMRRAIGSVAPSVLVLDCYRVSNIDTPLALLLIPLQRDYGRLNCIELTTEAAELFKRSKQPPLETVHIARNDLDFGFETVTARDVIDQLESAGRILKRRPSIAQSDRVQDAPRLRARCRSLER